MKPTVLGMLFMDSDPSAVIIVNGEIVAFAEEERFNRSKHSVSKFPINSVRYCLSKAGVEISGVDIIAVGWDASKFPVHMAKFYLNTWYKHQPCSRFALNWQTKTLNRYSAETLTQEIKENLFKGRSEKELPEIRFINHHFSHACSSFMVSGFDNAAILTADGHGEDDCINFWNVENGKILHVKQWVLPNSLGWFYTKFTQWFGFRTHDGEGKLMGLAAYGKHNTALIEKVHKVIYLTKCDKIFKVSSRFFFGEFIRDEAYTQEWIDLFGEPRTLESDEPFTNYHKDLAYAVQHVLEEIMIKLVRQLLEITGKSKLCVAGGTFMNCKMNGVIAREIGSGNFFVQPVAGDNGIALGAALAVYHQDNIKWETSLDHLYFGPEFTSTEIEDELKQHDLYYHLSNNIGKEVANLLAENKVIGWFQGRMEVGARALGNRSILGNPLDPNARDIINAKVKFREPWRPFCPSTIDSDAGEYFDISSEQPFMIIATTARDGIKSMLPSVVHVDNTVRVQTVRKNINEKYYSVINEFKKITGYGVVLNTSFNIKGEPIVCNPHDAIQCYLQTGIDVLAIGDFLVSKTN